MLLHVSTRPLHLLLLHHVKPVRSRTFVPMNPVLRRLMCYVPGSPCSICLPNFLSLMPFSSESLY
ncbi:unnamed protein product [Linum tenue]|uniref:Uncharacterized protein n=1 Tax=Linum tenue TaxID=586396 RepID=A0AAV0QVH7_9ROSI|nr:unnamed protein product [Linum tenue]